MELDNQKEANP